MFETLGKNIWTLITIILPGLCTYGSWRLLLLLQPSELLTSEIFTNIDQSSVLTSSIIISIALLQQIIGLIIEFILYLGARVTNNTNSNFHTLFCKRFQLAKEGKINTYCSSVIGNLFLSVNVLIGLTLLLVYFWYYEGLGSSHWITIFLISFMVLCAIAVVFRVLNALHVVKDLE